MEWERLGLWEQAGGLVLGDQESFEFALGQVRTLTEGEKGAVEAWAETTRRTGTAGAFETLVMEGIASAGWLEGRRLQTIAENELGVIGGSRSVAIREEVAGMRGRVTVFRNGLSEVDQSLKAAERYLRAKPGETGAVLEIVYRLNKRIRVVESAVGELAQKDAGVEVYREVGQELGRLIPPVLLARLVA